MADVFPFPVHTIEDYFQMRVPDIDKFLPNFQVKIAKDAAMAFYWRKLFPGDAEPYNLNPQRLSELQKSLIGLKMAVQAIPHMLSGAAGAAGISKATSGPDSFQFEERIKYYSSMTAAWQRELEQMETSLGLVPMAAKVPPFRRVLA